MKKLTLMVLATVAICGASTPNVSAKVVGDGAVAESTAASMEIVGDDWEPDEFDFSDGLLEYRISQYLAISGLPRYYATVVKGANQSELKKLSKIVIPTSITIESLPEDERTVYVEALSADAFRGFENLETIVLSRAFKTVGPKSFSGCTSLSSVEFPASQGGDWHLNIYVSAFDDCPALKTFDLSNVYFSFVYDDHTTAFANLEKFVCASNTTVFRTGNASAPADYPVKPDMVIDYGDCKNVEFYANGISWYTGEKLTIGNVVQLDNYYAAPVGAKHLKTVEFLAMNESAYSNNYLEYVCSAFSDCSGIESMIFHDGTMLKQSLDLQFAVPDAKQKITLYVPEDLIADFRNNSVWGTFGSIEPLTDAVSDISADASAAPTEYFNLQGVRVDNPQPGQVVIRRTGTKTEKTRF